ncbi:unnamed protein product [Prorocentrum cordatum]|uniref:PROP1-like PPR domain-containing protein n=1 Tax=Prorocentrum cordatum TaxID=2364126 RepID=A0ABN9X262_9DINO|nr:unnamed protein product [Polarella glacialis]
MQCHCYELVLAQDRRTERSHFQCCSDTSFVVLLSSGSMSASDKSSFSKAVADLLVAGDTRSAEAMLDSTSQQGPRGSRNKVFYHSLISSCARAGSLDGACWAFGRMAQVGLQPNVVTFNSVIDACAKAADPRRAVVWFDHMVQAGVQPNAITYNTIINACARGRDIPGAEAWFQRMTDAGVEPGIMSFSTIIDAYAKSGEMSRAEEWFEEMLKYGVRPDAVTFNALINACAKVPDASNAEHWLMQMREANLSPDEKTYNSIINACAKQGLVDRAEHWFGQVQRAGCKVDTFGYAAVIHASAKVGDLARAVYWFEEMQSYGLHPNLVCFNTMLNACVHKGDPKAADAWFQKLESRGIQPNSITFNSMISASTKSGDLLRVKYWLWRMLCTGNHPDSQTFCTLTRAFDAPDQAPAQSQVLACDAIIEAYGKVHGKNGIAAGARSWLDRRAKASLASRQAPAAPQAHPAPTRVCPVRPAQTSLAPPPGRFGLPAQPRFIAAGLLRDPAELPRASGAPRAEGGRGQDEGGPAPARPRAPARPLAALHRAVHAAHLRRGQQQLRRQRQLGVGGVVRACAGRRPLGGHALEGSPALRGRRHQRAADALPLQPLRRAKGCLACSLRSGSPRWCRATACSDLPAAASRRFQGFHNFPAADGCRLRHTLRLGARACGSRGVERMSCNLSRFATSALEPRCAWFNS